MLIEISTALGIAAGCLVAVGILWSKGIRPVYAFVKKLEEAHDYILVELPQWQTDVDEKIQELCPNGGESVYDKITRTDVGMTEVIATLEAHINDADLHS